MKLSRKYCRYCKRDTAHESKTANHILHLLLSVVTFGIWVPVWILLCFTSGPAHCRDCGTRKRGLIW